MKTNGQPVGMVTTEGNLSMDLWICPDWWHMGDIGGGGVCW